MNQAKLVIPSHSEPLQSEKIGKVTNWVKLAIPSHYEPLQWEKIGKVANEKLPSPVKGLLICSSLWMLQETHPY